MLCIDPLWKRESKTPTEVSLRTSSRSSEKSHLQRSLLSGTYLNRSNTSFQKCCSAPLCSCSGAIKNPTVSAIGHIRNGANRNVVPSLAGLAPRCCPFPASAAVVVVNAPLAQRISHYTPSSRRLPTLRRRQIEGQRRLGRARYHHAYRLTIAHVHLDMDDVRWDPDEITRQRILRLIE